MISKVLPEILLLGMREWWALGRSMAFFQNEKTNGMARKTKQEISFNYPPVN